jgi:hypothetical protein
MLEGAEIPAKIVLPSANDIHQFISANLCHAGVDLRSRRDASHLDRFIAAFGGRVDGGDSDWRCVAA